MKNEDKPPGYSDGNNSSTSCTYCSVQSPKIASKKFDKDLAATQNLQINRKNNSKKSDLLVYIFNVIEDEWTFISSINDAAKRFQYITDAEDATDAYFMSLAGEKEFVYISPKPISADFQTYTQHLLGYRTAHVIVPVLRSHLICEELIADYKALSSLIIIAKQYKRIVLVSYASTQEFYSLRDYLVHLGLTIYTPEAPKYGCSWTVGFYGSKSGIRQLAQKSQAQEPDFLMPNGIICVGRKDAAQIAANYYIKQRGVVIKTNKGSGGSGVLIFREGDLPADYRLCTVKILEQMNDDRYWDIYPIIIEELIKINPAIAGGYPNVEFKIHKNGRIEMLYVCACKVTPKGRFLGVDINEEIINDRIQTRIEDTGYFIAEQYASAGYRGHFDIDMIAARNSHIYVCETNTRHTGGTDIYKISKKLLGKNFMNKAYIISRSQKNWFKPRSLSLSEIFCLLGNLAYAKNKKEGIIINSSNSVSDGKLLYTIIGQNKKTAYAYEEKLIAKLADSGSLGADFPKNS